MKGIFIYEKFDRVEIIYKRFKILGLIPIIFHAILSFFALYITRSIPMMSYVMSFIFILLLYIYLPGIINQTRIHIKSNYIRFEHIPFPTFIFFQNCILLRKHFLKTAIQLSPKNGYSLEILTTMNSKVTINQIESWEHARYLEYKLKLYLGLEPD